MTAYDIPTKEKFLKEDFYNSLRWLFEGAIAWKANFDEPQRTRHQGVLGLFTSLVQARALYEFFYGSAGGDNARFSDFVGRWKPTQTDLYANYMTQESQRISEYFTSSMNGVNRRVVQKQTESALRIKCS